MTHLLFADDSVVFLEGSNANFERLHTVIQDYKVSSGQKVNLQKSSIFFGKGITEEGKARLNKTVGISSEALSERYLGHPTVDGKPKDGTFKYVRESAGKKVVG